MTRIPIIFLTGSLRLGGTERNILHLATGLDPRRFAVEVWSDYEGEPIQQQLRARGIPCTALKGAHSLGRPLVERLLRHNLPYQRRLYGLLRERREAVIHAFGFPMIYYAVLLGRLAGCRRILYAVQDWDLWKRSGIYSGLDRLCSRLAARAVADGEGARRLAIRRQGMAPDRIATIYDGVDVDGLRPSRSIEETRRNLGLASDRLTVGMIARLDIRKKGQDLFLRAIERLAPDPAAQFAIIGDGPDRKQIEDAASRLPPSLRPVLPGARSDLADVLSALDVLVIPSRWESVPKVLIEAMWLRRPVIAADVGDIPEILDATCGLMVRRNDADALSRAIAALISDPSLRARLAAAAHDRIESRGLTLPDSIAQYANLYESLHRS
jgi:glycosyltransferase involved in cell wall biosynthesis